MKSGLISSKVGRFISEFERKFAQYCGARYAITTANCTASLHLALAALDIGKGDEVIVPTLTFIATANAVTYTGAKPVFVDSHPDYWCLDPEQVERAITPRTRAVIPVHLFGHPCDMDAIMDIAKRHRLYVIEDAAEASGAEYKGRRVGSFGEVGCFSFFGNKILCTGEGGMCLTNDEKLAERITLSKDQGMDPDKHYWHYVIGFNYRMTNLQAAVGAAQTDKLDNFIKIRKEIAEVYKSLLNNMNGMVLPLEMPWAKRVYWMYPVLIEDDFGLSRDELIERMGKLGIETKPFFYPLHSMPPYREGKTFPVAEEVSRKGICLPCSAKLTKQDVELVAQGIGKILKAV
jgi:perosamine synthetase